MSEKELYQPKLLIKAYDKKDKLTLFDEVFNLMNCQNILCKESRTHYEYDENGNIINSMEDIMVDSNRSKVSAIYSNNNFNVRSLEVKYPKLKGTLNQNVIAGDREKINSITRISEDVLMKSKTEVGDIIKTINNTTFKSGDILDSLNIIKLRKKDKENYKLYKKTDFIVLEVFDDILFKGIEMEYTYNNDILVETIKSHAIYAYTSENELICVDKAYISRSQKEYKSFEDIIYPSMEISKDNKTLTISYKDSKEVYSKEVYNIDYKSKCLSLYEYIDDEETTVFKFKGEMRINYISQFDFDSKKIIINGDTNKYSPTRFNVSLQDNKLIFNSAAFLPAIYKGDTQGLCVNINNRINNISVIDNTKSINLSFEYDKYGVIKKQIESVVGSDNAGIIGKYYTHEIDDITIIESLIPIDSFLSNLGNCNYLYQLVEVKDGLIISNYKALLIRMKK